jgi:hypothetical protein
MSKADGTCDYCFRPASAHGHFDHKPIYHDEIIDRVFAEAAANRKEMPGPEFDDEDFLMRLASEGGHIVSTNALTPEQINTARAESRMYVNEDGFGFVLSAGSAVPSGVTGTPTADVSPAATVEKEKP